jgi:Ca2+/H+ antiporter
VTGASATRRPNRFETASMAAAAACAAVAAGLDLGSAPNTAVFLASGLALLTLAWVVGVATEQLGESSGPKIGGVLNATFGNAAELIITIFAIRAGQLEVATASITARSSGTPCSSSARHSSSAASATAPRRSTGVSPG